MSTRKLVSEIEMLEYCLNSDRAMMFKLIKERFIDADVDKDLVLSRVELREMFERLQETFISKVKITEAFIDRVFEDLDLNSDGKLMEYEFLPLA